jgi:1-acyl-sn-glycerol-3-phosphate acyltransferase
MWALAVMVGVVLVVVLRWRRSGLSAFDYFGLSFAHAYACFWHRWRPNGPAPFPSTGPAIVIANHTCSADPMFLLAGTNRMFSFVMAREHFNLCGAVRWILTSMDCVPVTRGGQDAGAARTALRRLAAGRILCIFPEGNLSGVAKNRLRPGKCGAALLALRSRAPIYPVYIAGGPRTEKLLRAWLHPSPVAVRVIYGQPVDLSAFADRPINRKTLEEATAFLMGQIAALRPLSENDFILAAKTDRFPIELKK